MVRQRTALSRLIVWATVHTVSALNTYELLDRACCDASRAVPSAGCTRLSSLYEQLPGFGVCVGAMLPLPSVRSLPAGQLQATTGLPPEAFAPPKAQGTTTRPPSLEAAAALTIGSVLSASGLTADDIVSSASLRDLASYELITLSVSVLLGMTTVLAAFDRLLLGARLLEALALLRPGRLEIVTRHEAGHFLCAYLCGLPVQACELNPARNILATNPALRLRVGTVFQSAAIEALRDGRPAHDADVDVAAIVLMGGIAAEALTRGCAEGGLSDERALQALLVAHHANSRSTDEDGAEALGLREVRARARWAAASATLILRERRSALDALCDALSAGCTLGDCVAAIEGALSDSAGGTAASRGALAPAYESCERKDRKESPVTVEMDVRGGGGGGCGGGGK